ncbi:MAG: hypothetical protein L0Y58_04665 [Verrucomicrobia subdivision 3 bacterium]|nr:hypothetical protein [Limisphaerales bacterium]
MAPTHNKGRIIVFGILFWYPLAGVTFQFLHYLLGLRRLGYDVFYVEDSARWIYDPNLNDLSPNATANVTTIARILKQHGLEDRWIFRGAYDGGQCYGQSESKLRELYSTADAFLNVTGAQELREEHLKIPSRIYVESDPFALQVKVARGDQGTIRMLSQHDALFSFGESLGTPNCAVPIEEFQWLPTRQPVVTDLWKCAECGGDTYSTITTWHNKGKDIEYNGDIWYWTKDREFEKFISLPREHNVRLELAATVGPEVQQLLRENGWATRDSLKLSQDCEQYRQYIQSSRAEFTVARDQYVRPRTGWFSDRSACYLAAGRPVITQETGFSRHLPAGRGLFAFQTQQEIVQAIDAIEADYAAHCRAAREIAYEYFAAEKVLASLMERAGL